MNVFVDVVVNMLASDSWLSGCTVQTIDGLCGILEFCLLGSKLLLDLIGVVVLEVTMLNTFEVVVMLLCEDLGVRYWLHGGMVMVLVHLLIDSGCDTVFLLLGNGLFCDSWIHLLLNGSIVFAILANEALSCILGGVHIEYD